MAIIIENFEKVEAKPRGATRNAINCGTIAFYGATKGREIVFAFVKFPTRCRKGVQGRPDNAGPPERKIHRKLPPASSNQLLFDSIVPNSPQKPPVPLSREVAVPASAGTVHKDSI